MTCQATEVKSQISYCRWLVEFLAPGLVNLPCLVAVMLARHFFSNLNLFVLLSVRFTALEDEDEGKVWES